MVVLIYLIAFHQQSIPSSFFFFSPHLIFVLFQLYIAFSTSSISPQYSLLPSVRKVGTSPFYVFPLYYHSFHLTPSSLSFYFLTLIILLLYCPLCHILSVTCPCRFLPNIHGKEYLIF